jgi:RimJ/RimL family protein N-acetyltransferase
VQYEKLLAVTIEGENVALGPLRRELIPLLARWRGDFAVQRTFGDIPHGVTVEEMTALYDQWAVDTKSYWFIIYDRATWQPVGHIDLFEIDWRSRTATLGLLIGEATARGRGLGSETVSLMLDYAFTALGLNSVMLLVDSFNLAGQAAYRKAGFREFGRRRQGSLLNGTLHDLIYMDCLASDFQSPLLSRIFSPDQPQAPAAGS